MRIVSLLPSATEIVYALGLEDGLVGVTFECDHPPAARAKRIVTSTSLPPGLDPAAIDAAVSEQVAAGASLYRLDEHTMRELAPDLVLTQDLCAVCAVDSNDVADALDHIGCRAGVVTLDPTTLDAVLDSIVTVGERAGVADRAVAVVHDLRARLDAVRRATQGLPRPRTLVLEWTDPPFTAGHWIPDMVEIAGGEPLLSTAGERSVRVGWPDVLAAEPDVVVIAPCGFELEAAQELAAAPALRDALAPTPAARAGRVVAVDASSFFVRPGPRLVDGVELLAGILHPGVSRAR